MSALETIKSAYAAFGRNDPSVLFGAMDSAISWNEAENVRVDSNEVLMSRSMGRHQPCPLRSVGVLLERHDLAALKVIDVTEGSVEWCAAVLHRATVPAEHHDGPT
jgi:hypothetical protein